MVALRYHKSTVALQRDRLFWKDFFRLSGDRTENAGITHHSLRCLSRISDTRFVLLYSIDLVIMSSPKAQNYGSVPDVENTEYDIDNLTGFVPNTALSAKDQRRRCYMSLCCILISALMIVGFGYFISRGVDSWYPSDGRGKKGPYSISERTSPRATPSADDETPARSFSVPAPRYPSPPKAKPNSASCSANKQCDKLGLTGLCCPTEEGTMLGCCLVAEPWRQRFVNPILLSKGRNVTSTRSSVPWLLWRHILNIKTGRHAQINCILSN